MRIQFTETADMENANKQCPWAYIIVQVGGEGLYLAFESQDDYITWCNQV